MKDLFKAAQDMRYLLAQGYPKVQALTWVGNRYQLSKTQRELLNRGIVAPLVALRRSQKKAGLWRLQKAVLGIDGHNVLITIESALKGKQLLLANDGFVRDISGVSSSYRTTNFTWKALEMIFVLFSIYKPFCTDWYFDAPLSHSGLLAHKVKKMLEAHRFTGKSQAVAVPEKFLRNYDLIATSDSALIDICAEVIDLAGEVINFFGLARSKNFLSFL